MRERGLSDREVAEAALCSHSLVHKLRHGFGGQVGVGTVWNLARVLRVRPCWLAFGDGDAEIERK